MPIHDWTRVGAGTFHAFHLSWISEIQLALNRGLLPASYYAQAEQVAGEYTPDVLMLEEQAPDGDERADFDSAGGTAVALAAPRTRVSVVTEEGSYLARKRRVTIRHSSNDRIVAWIELVSPGNKASQRAFQSFVRKATEGVRQGYHQLLVDLFPPTPRDPQGIHPAIWEELGGTVEALPPGEPLTLACYVGGGAYKAFVEPAAVGQSLFAMPVFLNRDYYVSVPLEATYMAAYEGVPMRWRRVLEPTSA